MGRMAALYRSWCNLECCFFTWLHNTFAALIAAHRTTLSPDIISQYSVAMLHYLKLFFNVSAACSFSLPYLRSPHLSSPYNSWTGIPLSSIFLHLCSPVELLCCNCSFTAVGLAVFPDFVLVNMSPFVMLTKINVKHNHQYSTCFLITVC